jgi:hypothetical protein
MSSLLHGPVYYLPPWQRGQEWTPAQQVAVCETVWNGLPLAPILLWERQVGPGVMNRVMVVLDGQQRLCALGADVRRHDGTPCAPTSAHLDLETGRWQAEPAAGYPPITMREVSSVRWLTRRCQETEAFTSRMVDLCAAAIDRVAEWTGVSYVMGVDVAPDTAVKAFRTWNIPGVPIPPDRVESLIQAADLRWCPPATPALEER